MRWFCYGLALCLLSFGLAAPGEAQSLSPNTYYQLQARHSGKCLDVAGNSTLNLATMQQWSCNPVPQPNQLWTVVATGSGTYRIVSANSAKCLDIAGASTANGALVQQYDCNITTYQTNQVFNIVASPTAGFYRIYAANNPSPTITRCLDVASSSTSNGAAVQQWDCAPYWGTNQDWTFVPFVDRQPLTHLKTFGYYGEMSNTRLDTVKDHVNNAVFTKGRGVEMSAADAAWRVKGKMAAVGELFVHAPKAVPTACPAATPSIYSTGPTVGGLRSDYVAYWNANIKPYLDPYASSIEMFYLDEPYAAMGHWGFCTNEIALMISQVSALLKLPGQFPTKPFAVVEYGAWVTQSFPGVDWVGTYCYTTNLTGCPGPNGVAMSYRTLLDNLEAGLTASQKVIVVPYAGVFRATRPTLPPPGVDVCETIASDLVTTPAEQSALVGLVDHYAGIAAADSKVVAMIPWLGITYLERNADPALTCRGPFWVGAMDMAPVVAKWRFIAKGLGFGYY
jgi:hypothetical protein